MLVFPAPPGPLRIVENPGAMSEPQHVNEHEFQKHADAFMQRLQAELNEFDPDELDANLAMGVLTMEFADGTKCVINRQSAARQIWLAANASAWHFAPDPATGEWRDTRAGVELRRQLSQVLSAKLGRPITLG